MNHTLRVEKRKWDGTISAVVPHAHPITTTDQALAWYLPAGAQRLRPTHPTVERLARDELWATSRGEWWVLRAETDERGYLDMVVHAAVPVEATAPDRIIWIDLDLDLEVHLDEISLRDESEFHCHAVTMAYPREVIRGAWAGIARVAPRYTTRGVALRRLARAVLRACQTRHRSRAGRQGR